MPSGLESLLWEDLGDIDGYTAGTREVLNRIIQSIQDGLIGQPNRQDSKHLNRLVVLTEMLYSEVKQWATEIDTRHQEMRALNDD